MTNFEDIKTMNIKELAEFLYANVEYLATEYGLSVEDMEEWLNSEVEE